MANNISIAEQVSQLTPEQQDKLYKVGKIATIWQIIGGIPWLIIAALGFFTLIDPPLGFNYDDYEKLYIGLMIWLAIGAVYLVGILVFVKTKYPYYSDAKWRYIHKMRKGK